MKRFGAPSVGIRRSPIQYTNALFLVLGTIFTLKDSTKVKQSQHLMCNQLSKHHDDITGHCDGLALTVAADSGMRANNQTLQLGNKTTNMHVNLSE